MKFSFWTKVKLMLRYLYARYKNMDDTTMALTNCLLGLVLRAEHSTHDIEQYNVSCKIETFSFTQCCRAHRISCIGNAHESSVNVRRVERIRTLKTHRCCFDEYEKCALFILAPLCSNYSSNGTLPNSGCVTQNRVRERVWCVVHAWALCCVCIFSGSR